MRIGMSNKKFVIFPLLFSSLNAMQQGSQVQVYPANAGEAVYTGQPGNTGITGDNTQVVSQTAEKKSNNIFLGYYAKQGNDFSMSVFYNENGNLVKRNISYDDLQKTVVIFFGNWCPHCHKFLTGFAKDISKITEKGVKVILISVPSVEKLKNWNDPTTQDYNTTISGLNSWGINPSTNVEIVLLGDRVALSKAGVSGLPVFIAVKQAKEYFRGVGSAGVAKINLSDPNILKQFLDIWDEDKKDEPKTSKEKKIKKTNKKEKKASKPAKKHVSVKRTKEAKIEARTATEMLNTSAWKLDLNRVS